MDYSIYLDEEQKERKEKNKDIKYVCLELIFFDKKSIDDNELSDDDDIGDKDDVLRTHLSAPLGAKKDDNREENKDDLENNYEFIFIIKMYNDKIEKHQNSGKTLKNDIINFLHKIKKNKKARLEDEYILHKNHYSSSIRYEKNKLIFTHISPFHEFFSKVDIQDYKKELIKVFEEFIESSNFFF